MARPTLRTAKMVSVLPTAHSIPASSAHTIRCGFSRRSLKRKPVPFSSVGTVQRATKAPITMPMEMMKGENPAFTSLVGASALPSQTAAASPQNTPSLCRESVDRTRRRAGALAHAFTSGSSAGWFPESARPTGTHRCTSVRMAIQRRSLQRFHLCQSHRPVLVVRLARRQRHRPRECGRRCRSPAWACLQARLAVNDFSSSAKLSV